MKTSTTSGRRHRVPVPVVQSEPEKEDTFPAVLQGVHDRFHMGVGLGFEKALFTTSVPGETLWATYLRHFPREDRQHHNCRSCRRFIEQYGGLAFIHPDGTHHSALWYDGAPAPYRKSVAALRDLVEKAVVTGVFVSPVQNLGDTLNFSTKHNRNWEHFHIKLPVARVHKHPLLSAAQKAAEHKEEYGMLQRGLAEYGPDVVNTALQIVKADALYRGEKVEGPLQWLADLHLARERVTNARKANVTWRASASAPAGWCHVKASVVSTLLDDLKAGLGFDTAKRRFAEKMHPLRYQRPTAPPKAGTVLQAEKAFEALGAQESLVRRFARIEEVELLWRPGPDKWTTPRGGMFGYLLEPPPSALVNNGGNITWVKFAAQVLPLAKSIEAFVPAHGNFLGTLTAQNPEAPCLFQWGNHFSWYLYHNGSSAADWGLSAKWTKVTGVMLKPNMWSGAHNPGNQGQGAVLLLEGARDRRPSHSCIFPENLKSEYHSVRSVIEAHSQRTRALASNQGTANGLLIGKQDPVRVRATVGGVCTEYVIDRWD